MCGVGDAHGAVECAVAFDCGRDCPADKSEDFEKPFLSLFGRWASLVVGGGVCRAAVLLGSWGCVGSDEGACFAADERRGFLVVGNWWGRKRRGVDLANA